MRLSTFLSSNQSRVPRGGKGLLPLVALGSLGIVCVVYLRTMPPGLVGVGRGLWDSQETQAVGVAWGYMHPPGYPLQSLLGNLLAHSIGALPGVEPAWGVTLLSVWAIVLTAGLLYRVVRRFTGSYVSAMLAMIVFALSPGPWRTAITPEVYALNLALWGLVFWLAIRAADATSPRAGLWLGLALGAAVGHHRTAVLLLPAVVLYLGIRRAAAVAWKRLLLGILLSAAIYLYLPMAHLWQSPMIPPDVTSVWDFLDYISARTWSVFFRVPASIGELWFSLGLALDGLIAQLGLVGTGLGLIGLGYLVWRRPKERLALLGLPAVGLLVFATVYQVPDVNTMLGPLVLILCAGLGGGIAGAWELTIGKRSSLLPASGLHLSPIGYQLLTVVMVAMLGSGLLVQNYVSVDESWDWRGQAALAELACELGGTTNEVWLTAESGYAGSLVAYLSGRIGRSLTWANPWEKWNYLAALIEGRRIFLIKDMPGAWQYPESLSRMAGPNRYLLPTGSPDLLELVDADLSPPVDQDYMALDQPFGSGIVLRGYTLRRCLGERGQMMLRLTLYWEALASPDQDWQVKAHLLSSDGAVLAQADSPAPARGARPTTAWQPGQVVRDAHDFRLPPEADLSEARAIVGLYQIVGDEFSGLAEAEIEVAESTNLP
jgi:hypothetical protein